MSKKKSSTKTALPPPSDPAIQIESSHDPMALPDLPPIAGPSEVGRASGPAAGATKAVLKKFDEAADVALVVSKEYQADILSRMDILAKAKIRIDNLSQILQEQQQQLLPRSNGSSATVSASSSLKVVAKGTQRVALPWFKHLYGQDLPRNPDGIARDLYLAATKLTPWSAAEKNMLKKEIIAHNGRQAANHAQQRGENIEEALAALDESYFIQSTEFIDWEKIALVFPRRSVMECKMQWLQHDHPGVNTTKWTSNEKEKMYAIADAKGCRDWLSIATELATNRTAADCLRQYRRRIVKKTLWSKEEDANLKEAIRIHGENWQTVSRLVGRHSDQCINRWTKTLRPTIKRGKWTKEEDDALRLAVQQVGPTWKLIQARMKGRTDAQCRERWVNILDPQLKNPRVWDKEEEEMLVRLKEGEGEPSWGVIAKAFGGTRTDNHCMRWYGEIVRRREQNSGNAAKKPRKSRKRAPAGEDGASGDWISQLGPTASNKKRRKSSASAVEAEDGTAAAVEEEGVQMDLDLVVDPALANPQAMILPELPTPAVATRKSTRAAAPRAVQPDFVVEEDE